MYALIPGKVFAGIIEINQKLLPVSLVQKFQTAKLSLWIFDNTFQKRAEIIGQALSITSGKQRPVEKDFCIQCIGVGLAKQLKFESVSARVPLLNCEADFAGHVLSASFK